MNVIIFNTDASLSEFPFRVRYSLPDADDRAIVERFISDVFYQAYGAKITHFKPCLMSLRDQDDKLVAACGFCSATLDPLFLEAYLDRPIEAVLAERTGLPVSRSDIIEIGNLSVAEPGMAHHLIAAIITQLHATSRQWAVFTAIPMLCNVFAKMNLNPVILGDADKSRLAPEELARWGSYYEQKPQIMAMQRIERRSETRAHKPVVQEVIACLESQTCP